jgi:hypothetical protein
MIQFQLALCVFPRTYRCTDRSLHTSTHVVSHVHPSTAHCFFFCAFRCNFRIKPNYSLQSSHSSVTMEYFGSLISSILSAIFLGLKTMLLVSFLFRLLYSEGSKPCKSPQAIRLQINTWFLALDHVSDERARYSPERPAHVVVSKGVVDARHVFGPEIKGQGVWV